ncbi:MAG: hypothetical protein ACI863_000211 [Flavobacteriales bacterium]|jgi:hypothetical protein
MKKNSFWDTTSNYMRFQIIAAGIILIVVVILVIGKAIFN